MDGFGCGVKKKVSRLHQALPHSHDKCWVYIFVMKVHIGLNLPILELLNGL